MREKIEQEQSPAVQVNPLAEWLNQLTEKLYFPKPALAFALILVVILAAKVFFILPHSQSVDQYAEQSVQQSQEYLQGVADEFDLASDDTNSGYGTDIEEYFL